MLAQELDLDRDHFLFDKLEKELQFQNQVVSISQRGDPFNELKMVKANDTFGDQMDHLGTRHRSFLASFWCPHLFWCSLHFADPST